MKINIKILMALVLLGYGISMSPKEIIASKITTPDHSITVFVHGTYPVRKALQFSFGRFLIYCPQGLSLAKNLPSYYHFHKMAKGCFELDSQSYSLDQFYVFGWKSEHVYDHVRAEAAVDLVGELQDLVNSYYTIHNVVPRIRMIGFSHGGNVVLHTASYLPLTVNEKMVDIEAWIFGTPVQHANKKLVNSPYFSRVYSFYSKKDWIQRMDPQGLRNSEISIKHFWSDRMFDLTDRCVQVEFTVNGYPISHTYYRSILKYFPTIQKITQNKSQGMSFGCIEVDLKK